MNIKHYPVWVLIFGSLLFTRPVFAEYDEGIEYKKLTPPVATQTGDKIEVVEMFWYGCPHCFRFEPHLHTWLKNKPANVKFIRIPAVFNPLWELHAKAYYTAEVLGVVEKIHKPLFDAIHIKKRKFKSEQALMKFFGEHGVKNEDFLSAFKSFAVDNKVRRAKDLTRRYGISGVPSMVVNGKYVTDGPMASGHNGMINIINYLIRQESRAK